jgi:hypothetical protein
LSVAVVFLPVFPVSFFVLSAIAQLLDADQVARNRATSHASRPVVHM